MSRKGQARVREVTPDPKFHDRTLAKFVNVVMVQGKKSLAEQLLYRALDTIAERSKEEGLVVFKRALDNIRPAGAPRSRCRSGWRPKFWKRPPIAAARSRSARIPIGWPRPTRPSLITDGRIDSNT